MKKQQPGKKSDFLEKMMRSNITVEKNSVVVLGGVNKTVNKVNIVQPREITSFEDLQKMFPDVNQKKEEKSQSLKLPDNKLDSADQYLLEMNLKKEYTNESDSDEKYTSESDSEEEYTSESDSEEEYANEADLSEEHTSETESDEESDRESDFDKESDQEMEELQKNIEEIGEKYYQKKYAGKVVGSLYTIEGVRTSDPGLKRELEIATERAKEAIKKKLADQHDQTKDHNKPKISTPSSVWGWLNPLGFLSKETKLELPSSSKEESNKEESKLKKKR